MGLYICYELRLPGKTTDEDAVRLLEALRVHALTLGVASTSPVSRLTGGDLSLDHDHWERWSVPWLLNRVVARFAGALHDTVSPHHRAEGAIFEHPDFERLETERLELRTKIEGK